MIRPLFLVYWLFSVCYTPFPMCLAGYLAPWPESVTALNDILKAEGWKQLVMFGLDQELKSINGEVMSVADLLSEGPDGNIVTPANYTDKLVKSSTSVSCFYGESLKFSNDLFVEIIAGRCKSMTKAAARLDCMERFWKTLDMNKSVIEKMLVVLNFFRKASAAMCSTTTTVIDILESLVPHYDRGRFIKSNYVDDTDGTIKEDDFNKDSKFLLDKMNCANKLLGEFLMARCLPAPAYKSENQKSKDILQIEEAFADYSSHEIINAIFDFYVENLIESEKSFLTGLGFPIVEDRYV